MGNAPSRANLWSYAALFLNTHDHVIALDGVYLPGPDGGKREFRALDAPTTVEIEEVLARTKKRIVRLLKKHGCLSSVSPEDAALVASQSADEPGTLDLFQAASIRGWAVSGDRPHPVELVGKRELETFPSKEGRFCAEAEGYGVHAGVRISGCDKEGREQLCRYILRPPFAAERLTKRDDGRILYEFRKTRFDGASHVILEPLELLEKLAALVPPPHYHLVHYAGVFGPHAGRRSEVVRARTKPETGAPPAGAGPAAGTTPAVAVAGSRSRMEPPGPDSTATGPASIDGRPVEAEPRGPKTSDPPECPRRGRRSRDDDDDTSDGSQDESPRRRRSRTDWASLMMRTLHLDVLRSHCTHRPNGLKFWRMRSDSFYKGPA